MSVNIDSGDEDTNSFSMQQRPPLEASVDIKVKCFTLYSRTPPLPAKCNSALFPDADAASTALSEAFILINLSLIG